MPATVVCEQCGGFLAPGGLMWALAQPVGTRMSHTSLADVVVVEGGLEFEAGGEVPVTDESLSGFSLLAYTRSEAMDLACGVPGSQYTYSGGPELDSSSTLALWCAGPDTGWTVV